MNKSYTHIYQNSYVIGIVCFLFLLALFYIFKIAPTTKIKNGKQVQELNWKYPLALSLLIWAFWHFFLYPPAGEKKVINKSCPVGLYPPAPIDQATSPMIRDNQQINMTNWL